MRTFNRVAFTLLVTMASMGLVHAQAPTTGGSQGSSVAASPVIIRLQDQPKEKQDYMRAHPEQYTMLPDGRVEVNRNLTVTGSATLLATDAATTAPSPKTESLEGPMTAPVLDQKAPAAVNNFNALPKQQQDYIKAHPQEYAVSPTGTVEQRAKFDPGVLRTPEVSAKTSPSDGGAASTANPVVKMTQSVFDGLTSEKKAFIRAHANEYEIIPDLIGK